MKIKNYGGLRDEVADAMQSAILLGGDCYYSFYLDPDCGEWYSAREADSYSMPEDVWNGHDIHLYTINERYFQDDLEGILEFTNDPQGMADRARAAYLKDGLAAIEDEMPDVAFGIEDSISDLTDEVMSVIDGALDDAGFDHD